MIDFLRVALFCLATLFALALTPPAHAEFFQVPDRPFSLMLDGAPVVLRPVEDGGQSVLAQSLGGRAAIWRAERHEDGFVLVSDSTQRGALRISEPVGLNSYGIDFVSDPADGTIWKLQKHSPSGWSMGLVAAAPDGRLLRLGAGFRMNDQGDIGDIFGLFLNGAGDDIFDLKISGARRAVIEFHRNMFDQGSLSPFAHDLDPREGLIFGLNTNGRLTLIVNLEPIRPPLTYGKILPDERPLPTGVTLGHQGAQPIDVSSVRIEDLTRNRKVLWETRPLAVIEPGHENVRRFPQDNPKSVIGATKALLCWPRRVQRTPFYRPSLQRAPRKPLIDVCRVKNWETLPSAQRPWKPQQDRACA